MGNRSTKPCVRCISVFNLSICLTNLDVHVHRRSPIYLCYVAVFWYKFDKFAYTMTHSGQFTCSGINKLVFSVIVQHHVS